MSRLVPLRYGFIVIKKILKKAQHPGRIFLSKMHSRCFGIMGGHGNFVFNLVVKLSVDVG
jgi:hypothetical protein